MGRVEYVIDQLVDMNIAEHPNILLHGCAGMSHVAIIEQFVSKRFGVGLPLHKRYPVWNGMPYVETDYYFEIDCFHPDFTNVLIDFLLHICRHKCIHLARHIIFLRNIDYFHRNNPQSLRVLFERFSQNVLFICSTRYVNKVERPLLSRMQLYRIPMERVGAGAGTIGKKEPRIKIELGDKDLIRKSAYRCFQQDVSIKDIVQAVLPSVKEPVEVVAIASEIEHTAAQCDPCKYVFHIELFLHRLKGFVT
jgi:hypothetical protein